MKKSCTFQGYALLTTKKNLKKLFQIGEKSSYLVQVGSEKFFVVVDFEQIGVGNQLDVFRGNNADFDFARRYIHKLAFSGDKIFQIYGIFIVFVKYNR